MVTEKILVIIPAYNCKDEILELLGDICEYRMPESLNFWVIDNLSSDCTYFAADAFIKKCSLTNVHVYQAFQNNNLGGTHKIGFSYAIEQGYDFVGIMHGDNQAQYSDLLSIIDMCRATKFKKSYLGTRFSRKSNLLGYSKKRIFGNVLLNTVYSIVKCRKLTDLGSGLNLYFVEDLKKVDYINFGDTLTFNYELLLEMIDLEIPFEFVPILWREFNQRSNANNFKIFFAGIRILANNMFHNRRIDKASEKIYKVRDKI